MATGWMLPHLPSLHIGGKFVKSGIAPKNPVVIWKDFAQVLSTDMIRLRHFTLDCYRVKKLSAAQEIMHRVGLSSLWTAAVKLNPGFVKPVHRIAEQFVNRLTGQEEAQFLLRNSLPREVQRLVIEQLGTGKFDPFVREGTHTRG